MRDWASMRLRAALGTPEVVHVITVGTAEPCEYDVATFGHRVAVEWAQDLVDRTINPYPRYWCRP